MPSPRSTVTHAGVNVIVAMAYPRVRLPQSFKGRHLRSVGDGVERRDTGPLGDTIDDHSARTALRYTAAEFDALRAHLVAQDVQQRFRAVRDGHCLEPVVYVKIEN